METPSEDSVPTEPGVRSPPVQTPPAQSVAEFELEEGEKWRAVYSQISSAEQECMRDAVGPHLDLFLQRRVELDGGIGTWMAPLFACLTLDHARTVFIVASERYLEDALGSPLDQAVEDCWRESLADADVVAAFAYEVSGVRTYAAPAGTPFPDLKISARQPGIGQRLLMGALPACAPELVLEALLDRFSLTLPELAQIERECLTERLAQVNVAAVIDPRSDRILGVLEAAESLGICAPRSFVARLSELVGVESIVLDTARLNCVEQLMSNSDLSSSIVSPPRVGHWQTLSILWFFLLSCWPEQVPSERDADPEDDHPIRRNDTRVNVGEPVQDVMDGIADIDWFDFEGDEGSHYIIDLRVANDQPFYGIIALQNDETRQYGFPSVSEDAGYTLHRLIVRAPESDHHRLQVVGHAYGHAPYTLSITEAEIEDDHGDTPTDATLAAVGEVIDAELEFDFDTDVFVFEAEADRTYLIETVLETLYSSTLSLEHNSGELLKQDYNDDDPGSARVVWTAPSSGRFVIKVSGIGRGEYTLAIWQPPDDHSNSTWMPTSLPLSASVAGKIDYVGDRDLFVFEAEQNNSYEITVSLGTLSDSELNVGIGDGSWVASNDDDRGSLSSRVVWRADDSRQYYITVWGRGTGTYTISAAQVDPLPMVGDAAVLPFGTLAPGSLDFAGDHDIYLFQATAGETYIITVYLYSLASVKYEVGKSADCPTDICALSERDRLWSGFDESRISRAVWTAEENGDHYIHLTGPGSGTYELVVTVAATESSSGD